MTDDEQPMEIIGPDLRKEVPDDDERDVRAVGFHNMTKAERQEMALRSQAVQRAKRQARQLAELEAYTDAHRELASQILGTKMVVLDGLIEEMRDPVTKMLDTSRLDDKRLKVLLGLTEQLEKRAFGGIVTKTETKHSGQVDLRAALVDLTKALQRPDTV